MIKREIVTEEVDVLSPIHQGAVDRTINNSNRMVSTAAHNPDSNDSTFIRTALRTDNSNKTVNTTARNSNRMVNTATHNPDSNDNTFSKTALTTDNNYKTVNTTPHNSDRMANNNNRIVKIRTPNSNRIRLGSRMVNGSTEPNQTMDNAENITITRRMGWVKGVQ